VVQTAVTNSLPIYDPWSCTPLRGDWRRVVCNSRMPASSFSFLPTLAELLFDEMIFVRTPPLNGSALGVGRCYRPFFLNFAPPFDWDSSLVQLGLLPPHSAFFFPPRFSVVQPFDPATFFSPAGFSFFLAGVPLVCLRKF